MKFIRTLHEVSLRASQAIEVYKREIDLIEKEINELKKKSYEKAEKEVKLYRKFLWFKFDKSPDSIQKEKDERCERLTQTTYNSQLLICHRGRFKEKLDFCKSIVHAGSTSTDRSSKVELDLKEYKWIYGA